MNINQPADKITIPGIKPRPDPDNRPRGLRGVSWMPTYYRNHFIALLGEFVGTFLFLFFAFSATQIANNKPPLIAASVYPQISNILYISIAFGFSLVVNAWVFFRITGGLFNPAVTLGLCLIGGITWTRGLIVFVAQILGGIAAAAVASSLFPGNLAVLTSLVPGCSVARGVFIEMFLTAELIFTIFMLAAEKHKATFMAPVGIGLSLFICHLAGVWWTGASLNPARTFGPAVVLGKFDSYHWIYWVGPLLGTLVAVAFYKLVKALEYETVNAGADEDEKSAEQFANDAPPPPPHPHPQHTRYETAKMGSGEKMV